jgi:NitT/TauT family transport system substrate-binding protein
VTILFTFLACTHKKEEPIYISTNAWIGYAPLFYAQKKGYLEQINTKLIINVSLAEASDKYDVGKAQMVTTTQHEYHMLKKGGHAIVPVMLLDRSYGGDMVLSNRDLETLQHADKIYAYLEIDSINRELLIDFMHYYGIDPKNVVFVNRDQAQIEDLKPMPDKNMLIVTYVPYNLPLQKRGFCKLSSTKELDTLIVIDALCTDEKLIESEKARMRKLKEIIDRSIEEIKKDPKSSYALVKGYLGEISYEEYLQSLKLIKWINHPTPELLERIDRLGYKKEGLIL